MSYFFMMATRKTLVEAKSQHRPEDRWFVMGPPSSGIWTLNTCWSAILVARCVRTVFGLAELRADRASLRAGGRPRISNHAGSAHDGPGGGDRTCSWDPAEPCSATSSGAQRADPRASGPDGRHGRPFRRRRGRSHPRTRHRCRGRTGGARSRPSRAKPSRAKPWTGTNPWQAACRDTRTLVGPEGGKRLELRDGTPTIYVRPGSKVCRTAKRDLPASGAARRRGAGHGQGGYLSPHGGKAGWLLRVDR